MRTNVLQHICPTCGSINHYVVNSYKLIDIDLSIEMSCEDCKTTWFDNYGLYYLGYSNNNGVYDRDGLQVG